MLRWEENTMSTLRRHEIARITIRYVQEEAILRRMRDGYYPYCRGNRRKECRQWPVWNIRYAYSSLSVRGGGQSMHWCDVCLPARYRKVASSMIRGHEKSRILLGTALRAVAGPSPARKATGYHIAWRSLL